MLEITARRSDQDAGKASPECQSVADHGRAPPFLRTAGHGFSPLALRSANSSSHFWRATMTARSVCMRIMLCKLFCMIEMVRSFAASRRSASASMASILARAAASSSSTRVRVFFGLIGKAPGQRVGQRAQYLVYLFGGVAGGGSGGPIAPRDVALRLLDGAAVQFHRAFAGRIIYALHYLCSLSMRSKGT